VALPCARLALLHHLYDHPPSIQSTFSAGCRERSSKSYTICWCRRVIFCLRGCSMAVNAQFIISEWTDGGKIYASKWMPHLFEVFLNRKPAPRSSAPCSKGMSL
jgi:hypothetical protein